MRGDALVLAPETPYPLAGGGALRTASLLHYLRQTREVDLVVFREPCASDPKLNIPLGLVRRIVVLDLPAHGQGFAARAARNAVRLARGIPPLLDRFAGFENRLGDILRGRRYEIGIVEHFWCAPYIRQLTQVCSSTVLDLHNVESHLHARCAATESGMEAFAHHVFRGASLELERMLLPQFSRVLTASAEDGKQVRRIAPTARVSVYPNAIPSVPLPAHADEEAIVFSGNMEYHPNRSAVRFFRNAVWPKLRTEWPRLIWRLIGKNPRGILPIVSGDDRIEVTGPVENAISEIARGRVAVVPLLAGSGTRLKILEAWGAGVPVVSTSIGAEGLPVREGEHILLADGAAEFAAATTRLLKCSSLRSNLGNSGRLLLEKEFTWETAWQKLDF